MSAMKVLEHFSESLWGETLGELIAPTRCAGCERQGALLCPDCLEALSRDYLVQQSCSKCAGPYGALTCTECWEIEYSFEAALSVGILDGPLARAVVLMKDANERRLAGILGGILAKHIRLHWRDWLTDKGVITWVPATKEAIRRRGYDHGELLAQAVANHLAVPAIPLLARRPKIKARDQRGLSRDERFIGSEQFSFAKEKDLAQHISKVLVIDDVFTTGATVEAAATTLAQAGIPHIRVAVLGRAW